MGGSSWCAHFFLSVLVAMKCHLSTGAVLVACMLALNLQGTFVTPSMKAVTESHTQTSAADVVTLFSSRSSEEIHTSMVDLGMVTRFFAGVALAAVLLITSGPARA